MSSKPLDLVLKERFTQAKQRASLFELTLEQFCILSKAPCHCCGILPRQYHMIYLRHYQEGYTKANCWPMCYKCKEMIGKDTWEAFMKRIFAIADKHC